MSAAPSSLLVSYAQNLEDVMLWRALGHVPGGFYIDVGAQEPRSDSVSRAFYERGWRGLHVEPSRHYADLLRTDRPDETVLEAALGDRAGSITFWELPDTGLSTGSPKQLATLSGQGRRPREITVACLTLETVLSPHAGRDIHWMKIDVEGMEEPLLRGWGDSPARPWIIVIESTDIGGRPNHQGWEPLVLSRGYAFAYFDGLNRFYVSHAHPELLPAFSHPPCVHDGYLLASTVHARAAATLLEQRIAALAACNASLNAGIATLSASHSVLNARLTTLNADLAALNAELSDHRERLRAESLESRRLRRLLYTASAGTHLYRAWQVLCADDRYTSDRPAATAPAPHAAKDYSNLRVPCHAHLCRAIRAVWMPGRNPWHTHLYRAFESLKGNPKYRNNRAC